MAIPYPSPILRKNISQILTEEHAVIYQIIVNPKLKHSVVLYKCIYLKVLQRDGETERSLLYFDTSIVIARNEHICNYDPYKNAQPSYMTLLSDHLQSLLLSVLVFLLNCHSVSENVSLKTDMKMLKVF